MSKCEFLLNFLKNDGFETPFLKIDGFIKTHANGAFVFGESIFEWMKGSSLYLQKYVLLSKRFMLFNYKGSFFWKSILHDTAAFEKKPQGANSKVYLSKLGKLTGELILPKAGKYCTVIWGICQLPFNDSGMKQGFS